MRVHDDVAEHLVEQQLPVGPPGAVDAAAEVLSAGSVQELMKVRLRLAQLLGEIVAVHHTVLRSLGAPRPPCRRLCTVQRRNDLAGARF